VSYDKGSDTNASTSAWACGVLTSSTQFAGRDIAHSVKNEPRPVFRFFAPWPGGSRRMPGRIEITLAPLAVFCKLRE